MASSAVVLVPQTKPAATAPPTPSLTQLALASPSAPSLAPATPLTDDSGILLPPEEIRSIIDRTASWVARNGSVFEQKVKEKQKDNTQFSFLRPGNPYYAYYQQKVREIRRVEVIAEAGDQESVANAVEIKMHVKKTLLGELPLPEGEETKTKLTSKKRQDLKKNILEPPPKEDWVLEKPNISALQDDIIKLSAQFVARNGRAFHSGLLEREHKNPQFGFLQNFHPLHNYFKKLVTDYTKCLLPDKTIDKFPELSKDKQAIVDKVMKKVQWEKAQKKTEEEKRREEEAERNAMSMIDWHDFVLVETIEWEEEEDDKEDGDTEPTTTIAPPRRTEMMPKVDSAIPPKPAAATVPVAAPVVQAPPVAPPIIAIKPQLPPPPPPPPEDIDENEVDMEMDEDEEFEPKKTDLPLVHGFNPRLSAASSSNTTLKYITPYGQHITPGEAALTMKIELSNGKVLEQQKEKALSERESPIAEGIEISKNLKNFVQQRTDIFGDDLDIPVGETKRTTTEKPTWDGHSSSIQRVAMEALGGMSVQQQIKAIHESKGLSGEATEPTIGPKLITSRSTSTTTSRPPEPPRPQPTPSNPPAAARAPLPYPSSMHPFPSGPPPVMRSFPIPMAPPFSRMSQPLLPPSAPMGKQNEAFPQPTGSSTTGADEPAAKRLKVKDSNDEITKKLIGEREFLEAHPGPVNIVVKVPNQPAGSVPASGKWSSQLNGQTYRVQVLISDTVKTLKQKLAELLEMPANKQKLRAEGLGYLKDVKTMAFYNITDNIEVELGIKERGGGRKKT